MNPASELEVVAYHEAGHVVASYALGIAVESATIERDGDTAGHTVHDYGPEINELREGDNQRWQVMAESIVMVSLAGIVAQQRFAPDFEIDEASQPDMMDAKRVVGDLVGFDDEVLTDAWLRVLRLRTARLMLQCWPEVVSVAHKLMELKTLVASDIRDALDTAIPAMRAWKQSHAAALMG
jgi:hypothetical protein